MDNIAREGMRYRVIVEATSPSGQLVALMTRWRTAGPVPHPILDCNVVEFHPYYVRVGTENRDKVGTNHIYHLPHSSIVAIQEYDHHWEPNPKLGFQVHQDSQ